MRSVPTLVLLATLLAGCNFLDSRACTQIGCTDGLQVNLSDPPSQTFSVSVVVNGEALQTIECPNGTCPQLFFEGIVADEVTIVVETADEVFEQIFIPDYQRLQPNGPGCPPICMVATVTMTLD